jgi:hypothetical protein
VRPRTRNEKLLLACLVAILFATGNWYGYKWYADKRDTLKSTASQLQAEQDAANVALQETPTWTKNKAWLIEKQPPLGALGDAKAAVLEAVQKGARANKLEIVEQSLGEVEPVPGGTRVNVAIKVKGSMEDLVKWLAPLEQPDNFYAVTLFTLKADTDQKSFDCTLQIARYFKGSAS